MSASIKLAYSANPSMVDAFTGTAKNVESSMFVRQQDITIVPERLQDGWVKYTSSVLGSSGSIQFNQIDQVHTISECFLDIGIPAGTLTLKQLAAPLVVNKVTLDWGNNQLYSFSPLGYFWYMFNKNRQERYSQMLTALGSTSDSVNPASVTHLILPIPLLHDGIYEQDEDQIPLPLIVKGNLNITLELASQSKYLSAGTFASFSNFDLFVRRTQGNQETANKIKDYISPAFGGYVYPIDYFASNAQSYSATSGTAFSIKNQMDQLIQNREATSILVAVTSDTNWTTNLQPFTTTTPSDVQLVLDNSTVFQMYNTQVYNEITHKQYGKVTQVNSVYYILIPLRTDDNVFLQHPNSIGTPGIDFTQRNYDLTITMGSTATFWVNLVAVFKGALVFYPDGRLSKIEKFTGGK